MFAAISANKKRWSVRLYFNLFCKEIHVLFMFVFMYVYYIPVSNHIRWSYYRLAVTRRLSGTTNSSGIPSSSVFSGIRVAQALCFCVLYCILLFVPFPLSPLCCLSYSDLRLLIDPLVSADASFSQQCDLFIRRTSNSINRNHNNTIL
jgi:hypothetical protein